MRNNSFSSRTPVLAVGVGIAIVGSLTQPWLVSIIYSDTAVLDILQVLYDSSLYFGSSMATATATLLGLMLTLLSLANSSSVNFDDRLYDRVKLISLLAVVGFLTSLLQLAVLSLPLGEFSSVPDYWFKVLYYLINTINFVIIGIVTSLTLFLTDAIFTAINKLHPGRESS